MVRLLAVSPSLLILVSLTLTASQPMQGYGTINVWTDRSVYYVGDSVEVSFDTGGGEIPASARIDITGPVSLTWGPFDLVTGTVYTATLSGATPIPGYYYVKVTLGLAYDVYTGTTAYQVVQGVMFDYSLTISPPSVTVKKGETANYNVDVRYSDPSYSGTTINVDVSGLGPGMTYTLARSGELSVVTSDATPPGTYTIKLTGSAQGVTHTTTATLIVEELKAVLTYVSVSGIPSFGSPIYVGESSKTIAIISNTGNAKARAVKVVLEEISPNTGLTVTNFDPPKDIDPLGTAQWTIDVRGDLPGKYKGMLRVYAENNRILEHEWELEVAAPEIVIGTRESSAQGGQVYTGDTIIITYTLKNTSPVDAQNISIDVETSDGLTVLEKPTVAIIPSQSEVKAAVKLRSDKAGAEWVRTIVSSYGTVVREDTININIAERPMWEQQWFLIAAAGIGAATVVIALLLMRRRRPKAPQAVLGEQRRPSEPTSLCPRCGRPLTFVQTHSRWYCAKCKEYV